MTKTQPMPKPNWPTSEVHLLRKQLRSDERDIAARGADKNYDAEAFVEGLKGRGITPHVAVNGTVSKLGKVRKTSVPSDVVTSLGYAISLRIRKRIEESFGWARVIGGLAQLKVRGLDKVAAVFPFAMAAYNVVRLPKLLQSTGEVCLDGGKIAGNEGENRSYPSPLLPNPAKNQTRDRRLRSRNRFFSSLLGCGDDLTI